MDSKGIKLSRPRKLNFLPDKERSPKQLGKTVTLEEVDRLFDNLDSSLDKELEKKGASSGPMGTKGEFPPPAEPVKNTEHNLVRLEASSPFIEHCPIKTSSPVDGTHVDRRVMTVSPNPFLWDDEEVPEEDPKTARPSTARAQSQGSLQPPQASSEQLVSAWRPEPQLPSTSGSRQPAAVKPPRARKDHTSAFIQRLRETGLSKAPWRSPFKEPAPPQEPEEEPEEEFMIWDEDPPARITIPRKKNPSTYKQNGPNAQQKRNDNNNDGQPSSPDQGLKNDPSQKAETQATGHRGERASLEEGNNNNKKKKKKKKEKAAIPSLPSPKKSAVKRAKSKGTEIPTEMVEQEPSPSSDVVDHGEDHEKKKKGRKTVTKERMPSHSRPQVQPPHHSPSQAVKIKAAPTVANKEQSCTSVPKRSKSTKGPQQEVEEKKEKTKAGKPVKRRQREEVLWSEPPPSNTEAEHFNMCPAILEVRPLLTSEEAGLSDPSLIPGKRSRKRPGERWLSPSSSPEEPGGPPALKAPKQDPRRHQPGAAEPLLVSLLESSPEPAPDGETRRTSRTRNGPGEWWKLSDALPDILQPPHPPPTPPQPQRQKARKGGRWQSKQRRSLNPPTPPRAPTTTTGSKPFKRGKMSSAPKTIKGSLATVQDIFSQTAEESPPDGVKEAAREEAEGGKRSRRKMRLPSPPGRCSGGDADIRDVHIPLDALHSSGAPLIIEAPADRCSTRLSWASNIAPPKPNKRLSASMVNGFQSGPSSPIDREQHEEDGHKSLQSTRTQCGYWVSLGLYAPPLVPMVLQSQDKGNLEEWLSLLWPAPAQAPSSQTSSEDFQWFCHQGRAIGLQVDMCSESMCNGKIILASYMKKPLWVDHCAITVFFMSTSCVVLTLNAVDSRYSAGQSFVVPCGHAYSIENLGDEPAVIFFSRVQAQSPE